MELCDWSKRYEGRPFVVLGLGESVSDLHQYKEISPDSLLIGVNDIGRFIQPNFLILANRKQQFTPERWDYICDSKAQIFLAAMGGEWEETKTDLWNRCEIPPIEVNVRRGVPDLSNPHLLGCRFTSPYIGVCLAAHLGAKRIGLLGVDFSTPHTLQERLAEIDKGYKELGETLKANGVDLINISPVSRLEGLPKADAKTF